MFKLGKIQNKVIEEPKRSNLLFQDNICPFCGNNNQGDFNPAPQIENHWLYKIEYRKITIRCAECKAKFEKRINDKVYFKKPSLRFIFFIIIICLIVLSIGFSILYAFTQFSWLITCVVIFMTLLTVLALSLPFTI